MPGVMDTESKRDLAGINYIGAINHYNQQKEKFKQQYSQAAQDLDEEIINTYIDDLAQEINASPIQDQYKIIDELIGEVRTAVIEKMKNGEKSIAKYKNELRKKYNNKLTLGKEIIATEANALLSEEQLQQMIISAISTDVSTLKGYSTEDLLNQLRSFRNRVFTQRLKTTNILTGAYYKRSGKGYVREALVHGAFATLMGHIDEKYAMHTGSTKINGKDSEMDEFISFLSDIDEVYQEVAAATANLDYKNNKHGNLGYGVQVKSWIQPWENHQHSQWGYSIGNRKNLLNSLPEEDSHDWSRGVRFLGQKLNTLAAIGPANVFFITGKNFQWTADLISKFRQNQYYLAFALSNKNHKLSAHVGWEQYDSSKVDHGK